MTLYYKLSLGRIAIVLKRRKLDRRFGSYRSEYIISGHVEKYVLVCYSAVQWIPSEAMGTLAGDLNGCCQPLSALSHIRTKKKIGKFMYSKASRYATSQIRGFELGPKCFRYSSNKIRKTQNEHLNIICQNLNSQ
jgi:hypothetical protein